MSKKLAIFTMLLAMAASAGALQISQTENFSGIPNLNTPLTFDQFNDNGGAYILNSIQVLFNMTSNGGSVILDNDSEEPASGTLEFGATGEISSTDVGLVDASFQPVVGQLDAYHSSSFGLTGDPSPIPNDYNSAPTDGMMYTGGVESDSGSGFIASAVFGQYIGLGTYDIAVEALQWTDFGSVGGIEYAVTPVSVDGCVTVIYDYTIPEPATMALLALGLGFLKKRKTLK